MSLNFWKVLLLGSLLTAGCANSVGRVALSGGAFQATAPVAGERSLLQGPQVTSGGGMQEYCGASPLATNGSISECSGGKRCDDRGDGVKVCMGGGSENAWCVSTADCGYALMCRAHQCRP